MVKKLCSILMIIMLLLNSSLLTIISTAVEDVSNTEKISMDLSNFEMKDLTTKEKLNEFLQAVEDGLKNSK